VKVVVFLAESAVVRDGRVDFLGVGWQMAAPDFSGCVVGIVVEVPWEDTSDNDRTVEVSVTGRTLEGGEVIDTPQHLTLAKTFTALTGTTLLGAPVRGVIPCPIPPATLQPHSLYTVRVAIDGSTSEDWSANFYTWGDEPPGRPAAPAT
jgi:hypothetical protein